MRRIVSLYITREDFLSIKPLSEGGTTLDGRKYAQFDGIRSTPKQQLEDLGKPDKTGEGVISKVFFFEVLEEYDRSDVIGVKDPETCLRLVSAEIVDHYESEQELQKEIALIRAKIELKDKENQ